MEGTAPNGDTWALTYRPEGFGGRHYMAFLVNGGVQEDGAGWDIPGTTEIGFAGGFKRGEGNRYIYGLVTSRIVIMRAESYNKDNQSEVTTVALPAATTENGDPLRTFVLIRQPEDDVTAIVGLDDDGRVVQRIPFHIPPDSTD